MDDTYRDAANYTGYVFPFEASFDPTWTSWFLQNYWYHSITASIIYVIALHLGQYLMRDRKPYRLEGWLQLWNYCLAVFSTCGAIRATQEMLHVVSNHGLLSSICHISIANCFVTYWCEKFTYSKLIELGDTAFLVLRKRPVSFLHWYHHVTVMVYTWNAVKDHTTAGRWFIWMNYCVHSVMYTYYALMSSGWRLPKRIAASVTSLQLGQMLVGCVITYTVYSQKTAGHHCHQQMHNIYLCFLMYFTYFLLFLNYFHRAYVSRSRVKSAAVNGLKSKAQ